VLFCAPFVFGLFCFLRIHALLSVVHQSCQRDGTLGERRRNDVDEPLKICPYRISSCYYNTFQRSAITGQQCRHSSRYICGSRLSVLFLNQPSLRSNTSAGSIIQQHPRRIFPSFGEHGLRHKCVMCHMPLQAGRGQIAARRRIWQTRAGDLGLADRCTAGDMVRFIP
jgi:hypothetical protein